jgi:glycosyltransferase involved in cell wall biosynthesis
MITVLHVRNANYPGGIEAILLGWLKEIDRTQFNARLLIFDERRGIHVRSMEFMQERGLPSELLPWGHVRNLPGAVYRLVKIIRSQPNVIVHSHDTRSDLVSIIAAKITGVPVVISNHAWHPADLKRKILEKIRVHLMHFADLVISVSKDTHRETLERGINPAKATYLYAGIDLERFKNPPSRSEARAVLGIADEDFVVANIARLWPEKEQDKIITAAASLVPRYPQLRFLIVGDGPLEQALAEQIDRLGVQNAVSLLGFRKDIMNILAAIDVFAFPSSAEGTPIAIYEAMAMGLAIVASPVSGIGEVLTDGSTALLIPPADADALANAIERLVQDPAYALSLGTKARIEVETEHSVVQATRNLEKIYLQLDANRGNSGK